ncbi:TetR/AcrR family transcriptional regulator C-terminal domain-containing protein [Streptomyces sp. NPDC002133]|uniref:TetR/AcrR family transcriptional regulator C-terminal domain-containing protein n=1 Tax=Streptomyces sp. NPDC002133 TaxID=3154409 RepID=UPI0033169134
MLCAISSPAEAHRFPELGQTWQGRGSDGHHPALAGVLHTLADQGTLGIPDPEAAIIQLYARLVFPHMVFSDYATSQTASSPAASTCPEPLRTTTRIGTIRPQHVARRSDSHRRDGRSYDGERRRGSRRCALGPSVASTRRRPWVASVG